MRRRKNVLRSARLGRFSSDAARYTSSIVIDGRLLEAVVNINSAHVIMLFEQGLIKERKDARLLLSSLQKIPKRFEMDHALEDVHMNVESRIIANVGKEVGGMLNLGKSRNDQVSAALRIALRSELLKLGRSLVELQEVILRKASEHASTIMPGYTHLQRAQPLTLGHHLLSYFDSLDRDFERLVQCYSRVNCSPMGAGALASTTLPINRRQVATLLGFDSLVENSVDAVSSRDFATEAIFVSSQVMADIGRLSEEIVLWATREFSFVSLPDSYSSTSSMMPQKKNPVVAEIQRARSSQVVGDLVGALSIIHSLPMSYNLDLQELTHNLWGALDKTISSVEVLAAMLKETKFNKKRLLEAVSAPEDFLYATDLADWLVTEHGLSFREAHNRVGELASLAAKNGASSVLSPETVSTVLGVEVSKKELEAFMDPKRSLEKRRAEGSPNPSLVSKACLRRKLALSRNRKEILELEEKIEVSQRKLKEAIVKITKGR